MCLLTTQKKALIAEQDITCYKVVRFLRQNNVYITPCQGVIIDKKIIRGKKLFKAKGRLIREWFGIERGGIHTFKFVSSARDYAALFEGHVIYECIIPKGTKYYCGGFGQLNWTSFASKQIRFVKTLRNP